MLTPKPLPALTSACKLLTRRAITPTLSAAITTVPARVADAPARALIAHRVDAAVAVVVALRSPVTGMAGAFARLLVTFPFQTVAGLLAVFTPAVGVARALPSHVVTFTVRVARAHALAVRTPKLTGTLCVTTCPKISMTTAAFVWSDTHLVLITSEVAFTERC